MNFMVAEHHGGLCDPDPQDLPQYAPKMGIAPAAARSILNGVKGSHRFQGMAVLFFFAASALFSGCGGFSGSHSVSPATLLLPGLLKADPAHRSAPGSPTNGVALTATTTQVVAMAAVVRVPAH
jgi:hypothetical protein